MEWPLTRARELCEFLRRGADKDVWLAVVELMSRSGSTAWTESLEDAIVNAQARGNWMDERFWARHDLIIVHRMVRNAPELCEQLRRPLESLAGACYKELPARHGLEGDDRQYLPARSRFHEIARSRATEPEQLGLRVDAAVGNRARG